MIIHWLSAHRVVIAGLLGIVTFTACAAGSPGPHIRAIRSTVIDDQQATVEWRVTPASTGQVEYGPTPDYGQLSTFEPSYRGRHVQRLSGLDPDTEYHFRVIASARDGTTAASSDYAFTTASLTQPAAVTGIYGSGIAGDEKNNYPIDGRLLSHRFRASTTSDLLSIRFQQRGGPGYSSGTGGTLRISVQSDDGSEEHLPSGTVLASVTISPGNPSIEWTRYDAFSFPKPARLKAGHLYHIVFENIDPAPGRNFISVNELLNWEERDPRQPAFDDDFAVLYDRGGGWRLSAHDTSTMDLAYADGTHDGQAYIENMFFEYGIVSGPLAMVRELFTVSGGDREVTEAWVRVGRTFGESPLGIQVIDENDDTMLGEGQVPAADIPLTEPGTVDGAAAWVSITFPAPLVLRDGETYSLRLSTAEDTQYTADPIREGTDSGMRSYRFTDGSAQDTADGGQDWIDLYQWSPVDLQFYFRSTSAQ